MPRFLIAKYAPDLHRMEPRNFGVIAWSNGAVYAKFLGETRDGKVRPPHMVRPDARLAYRQWIQYWRLQIAKSALNLSGHGDVRRDSPEFVDALLAKSKEQFMLVEGGRLLREIEKAELPDFTNELFEGLVEPVTAEEQHKAEAELLHAASREIFKKTGLWKHEQFYTRFPQVCRMHGVLRQIVFDHGFGDTGHPTIVFQHVLLNRQTTIGNALNMFEWYGQMPAAPPRERMITLLYGSQGATSDTEVLSKVSTVIDVTSPEHAEHLIATAAFGA